MAVGLVGELPTKENHIGPLKRGISGGRSDQEASVGSYYLKSFQFQLQGHMGADGQLQSLVGGAVFGSIKVVGGDTYLDLVMFRAAF